VETEDLNELIIDHYIERYNETEKVTCTEKAGTEYISIRFTIQLVHRFSCRNHCKFDDQPKIPQEKNPAEMFHMFEILLCLVWAACHFEINENLVDVQEHHYNQCENPNLGHEALKGDQ
jgi:hypothetical protein